MDVTNYDKIEPLYKLQINFQHQDQSHYNNEKQKFHFGCL